MADALLRRQPQTAFLDRFATAFGRRQSFLLKAAGLDSAEIRASGAEVVGVDGRRWLDFGSFGVHFLGHSHPDIVAAASGALDRMGLSTKILPNAAALECAEKLIELAASRLDTVVFNNSGAEAAECAIRLASSATGRRRFAALEKAYHGRTLGAAALTDSPFRAPAAEGALDVLRLSRDDAESAAAAIRGGELAAVFIETIQGEGGIHELDRAYLQAVEAACRESGALLVVDEIQTGLGRTGAAFGFHRAGISPDIILLGKTLGGGLLPVAATLFSRSAVGERAADPGMHSSSFAGGTLASTVATAVVELVADPALQKRVRSRGEIFRQGLEEVRRESRSIRAVRGCGLMVGIEFDSTTNCGEVILELAARGLLVTFCLTNPAVMRIYPPVTAESADLNRAIGLFAEAVKTVEQEAG